MPESSPPGGAPRPRTGAAIQGRWHQLFEIGIWIKGVDAVIECGAGVALAIIGTKTIVRWVDGLAWAELIENPHDVVAGQLLALTHHVPLGAETFYAAYLLGHGAIKLVLVAGLLTGKLWSYPVAVAALVAFIAYQIYRLCLTASTGLMILTVFDVVVVLLIWHEWRRVRAAR